jgi:putative regulator of septum formation
VVAAIVMLVKRFPIWTGIGVFALGGFLFRDFISGSVADLKVGDCFDPPALTTAVKEVQHHPCTDLHRSEIFFVGNVPGASGAYPGDAEFASYVRAQCVPAFLSYTGRDFDIDLVYDVHYLSPTPEGWKKGDHAIDCFVVRVDGTSFKGSVKAVR